MACVAATQLIFTSEYATLTEKVCVGINNASHDGNLDIPDIIFTEHCNIIVHKVCRNKHTNPKSVKTAQKRLTYSVFCIQEFAIWVKCL